MSIAWAERPYPVQGESRLPPLPAPVWFVIRDPRWVSLVERGVAPAVDEIASELRMPADCWVVQTWIQLRRRGCDVQLTRQLQPGAINVLANIEVTRRDVRPDCYLVVCRHDLGRPGICHRRIVQNELNVWDSTDHLVPHWPQPGLLQRDPARGTRVERLVFMGGPNNLDPAFRSPEFRAALAAEGVTLDIGRESRPDDAPVEWCDYRDADLVLAVRNLTHYDASNKPASKLVNAWLAGVPALLGPEPAFRALYVDERDFVEVRRPEDVLRAVRRLRAEPERYRAMIERGFTRGREFTADAVARRWWEVLAGPVHTDFVDWQRRSLAARSRRWARRLIEHRRAALEFRRSILDGPRVLDEPLPDVLRRT